MPTFWEYFGYALCPGTTVFGPWVPYKDYLSIFNNPIWVSFLQILSRFYLDFIQILSRFYEDKIRLESSFMTSNSWLFRILAIFQNSYFCFIYQFSHYSIIHYNYLIIHNQISFQNPNWLLKVIFSVTLSLLFLTISTCWIPMFIPDMK